MGEGISKGINTLSLSNALQENNLDKIALEVKESWWHRQYRHFFESKHSSELDVGLQAIQKLKDDLRTFEQNGVTKFSKTLESAHIKQEKQNYQIACQNYTALFKAFETWIQPQLQDKAIKKDFLALKRQYLGLLYSVREENYGLNKVKKNQAVDLKLADKLKEKAKEWRKQHLLPDLVLQKMGKELYPLEEMQLEDAARYPEFAKFLLEEEEDSGLEEFFNWALSDYQPVKAYIETPCTQNAIKSAKLPCYLGASRPHLAEIRKGTKHEILRFKKTEENNGISKRILTLPFYDGSYETFEANKHFRVNILSPDEKIHFKRGNYCLTVKEFFALSARKKDEEVTVNICAFEDVEGPDVQCGFTNHHPTKHGYWDADKKSYYEYNMADEKSHEKFLPPFRVVTQEELQKRYGEKFKGFLYAIRASRSTDDLNSRDCHAYTQMHFPLSHAKYKIINPGAFADHFFRNQLEAAWMFCETNWRVIADADQNAYYSRRQQAKKTEFLDEKEWDHLMVHLKDSWRAKGFFQFSGENCAGWVQLLSDTILGDDRVNYFRMPALKSIIHIPPADKWLAFLDQHPGWIQSVGTFLTHALLGSWRFKWTIDKGRFVCRSVLGYFWHQPSIKTTYNPSYFFHQGLLAHAQAQRFDELEKIVNDIDQSIIEPMNKIEAIAEHAGKDIVADPDQDHEKMHRYECLSNELGHLEKIGKEAIQELQGFKIERFILKVEDILKQVVIEEKSEQAQKLKDLKRALANIQKTDLKSVNQLQSLKEIAIQLGEEIIDPLTKQKINVRKFEDMEIYQGNISRFYV